MMGLQHERACSMVDNLAKTLGWSVLLHLLLLAALWVSQRPLPQQVATPKAIRTFLYQPLPPPAQPAIDKRPATTAPAPSATPQQPEPAVARQQKAPVASVSSNAALRDPNLPKVPSTDLSPPLSSALPETPAKVQPQTNDATHVIASAQDATATMSLAERSLAIANRRQAAITSADLAASQQRPELRDRPATTAKAQLKPEHVADNVLMVLKDGSFLEKIGDYCYHANDGANLRADISSMKPVPCGEDKNAALFERIMRKVGQDR